jgi:hypothetical protein
MSRVGFRSELPLQRSDLFFCLRQIRLYLVTLSRGRIALYFGISLCGPSVDHPCPCLRFERLQRCLRLGLHQIPQRSRQFAGAVFDFVRQVGMRDAHGTSSHNVFRDLPNALSGALILSFFTYWHSLLAVGMSP